MPVSDIDEIWSPVIYFGNAINVWDLDSFGTDQETLSNLWSNFKHPYMQFSIKFTSKMSCKMNFNNFPFDKHDCQIMLINWEGATYRVLLNDPKVYTYDKEKHKEVGGKKIQIKSEKLYYLFDFEALGSFDFFENEYNYSMILIGLNISRTQEGRTKIFSTFHVPIGVFALTSLISFFIDLDCVPGRMGLLITLCLIIINSYNSIDAPSRRGFSPIEIWFVGNLFPILLGILEYGIVLFLKKYFKQKCIKIKDLDLTSFARVMDLFTFALLVVYIIAFNLYYWYF